MLYEVITYVYEKAIQAALREVEDAIVGYRKGGEVRVASEKRTSADRIVLHRNNFV